MDDLGDFLRQRKIPEETIETMLKEKIDTNVIQLMTDEELKSYLPSYGDRLALLGYCKRRENGTPNSRKSKLFERLKSKLELREGVLDSSNILFLGEFSDSEPQILDDTLPMSPQTTSSAEAVKKILVVHRGQVLPELVAHFCDDGLLDSDFKIQLVLPDGKPEMGYDDGGVVRDCLSEFWKEFYDQCTTGNAYKVPFLRHDYGQQQWESVGRIITFGWTREKYLPVKIAPVILEQAAFGQVKFP
ncbi:hypothetical protein ATANTOWER_023235 [Ataeniobius toweri]|uniref:Uncharacterized protein n=1 Tax=Ataeniobius toweri TaxID=208326 RepID=A0ABU7AR78_9TELE|nr:hypothetical protein [Ataeniobius toweri]